MAKFERPKKNKGNSDKDDGPDISGFEQIHEPRCEVCNHKERNRIDYLLALRTPYKELERLYKDGDKITIGYRSFSNHDQKHLRYEDESIKQVIEYEAGVAGENMKHGVRGAFTRRAVLDVSIKKILDGVVAGEIPLEAKDVVKMIEAREKLDAASASVQVEQYELQFNAFKEAIEQVCPPLMLQEILDVVKVKLQLPDRPALQEESDDV